MARNKAKLGRPRKPEADRMNDRVNLRIDSQMVSDLIVLQNKYKANNSTIIRKALTELIIAETSGQRGT